MKLMLAQNTAQQRAAARTEQQAQRNGRQANPCADGKGAGESAPALRAKIYE